MNNEEDGNARRAWIYRCVLGDGLNTHPGVRFKSQDSVPYDTYDGLMIIHHANSAFMYTRLCALIPSTLASGKAFRFSGAGR